MSSYPDFALLAVPALREMQMHTSSHTAGNADADYSGLCVIDILTPSKILWFYKSKALATQPMERRLGGVVQAGFCSAPGDVK
jgi:hypothetical protein